MLGRSVRAVTRRMAPVRFGAAQIRGAKTLVLAEHDNTALNEATRHTITAATSLGDDITVLVAGQDASSVVEAVSKVTGVKRVISASGDAFKHQLAENLTPLVAELQDKETFSHILAPASPFGKNLLPRVGGTLDVAQIGDVISIESEDTFTRPVYAGNAIARVRSKDALKLLTIRATSFERAEDAGDATVEDYQAICSASESIEWLSDDFQKSERPELASADIVVSGGRGLKDGEKFDAILAPLADKLNAAMGASRAAVDAGFCSNDLQVGQTGKVVAPSLYVAVGISGAIQHLAGMKDSKCIVAINSDPEAPIFQVADYGLVADLNTAIPELVTELGKE